MQLFAKIAVIERCITKSATTPNNKQQKVKHLDKKNDLEETLSPYGLTSCNYGDHKIIQRVQSKILHTMVCLYLHPAQ